MARISPDGMRIALVVGSALPPSDPPPDIYVFDLKTENLTQLTFSPRADDGPVWSRDGSRIYYRAFETDSTAPIYALPADGGKPELVARSEAGRPLPWSMSADGNTLLLVDAVSLTDINRRRRSISARAKRSSRCSISPNSLGALAITERPVAVLQTGSTTESQVDVRPYPDVTQQRRPVGPGLGPVFSPDGSEIFVFDGAGLSSAPMQYSPFRIGVLRKLFRGQYWYGIGGADGAYGRAWDVDPKNDRFLMITLPHGSTGAAAPPQAHVNVVLNWFEELKQRVPKH